MTSIENSRARAVADLDDGYVLAAVEIGAPPERVFRALASNEIVDWWVRPGVFPMQNGQVACVGGRWRASGKVNGQPFTPEGEFLEIAPPRRLVHTACRAACGSGQSARHPGPRCDRAGLRRGPPWFRLSCLERGLDPRPLDRARRHPRRRRSECRVSQAL